MPGRHWYDPDLGSGATHCRPGQVRYLPPGEDSGGLVDAYQPEPFPILERVATIASIGVVVAVLSAIFIVAVVYAGRL